MSDGLNIMEGSDNRAKTRGQDGYSRGPVLAGGVIGALLVPALILGCIGAANAITTDRSVSNTSNQEAPPATVPGDEVPGAADPLTPPDRDSDQTKVEQHEDEIYYIQDGDTLTSLSAKFGVSVDFLAEYNAVRDVDVISEGAVLRMPFLYEPPAPSKTKD